MVRRDDRPGRDDNESRLAMLGTGQHPLTRRGTPLTSCVIVDGILRDALTPFDLDVETPTTFHPWEFPAQLIPDRFGIGLIVGASGSGKSTLLRELGDPESPAWSKDRAIVSHFVDAADGTAKLAAAGLNSVPVWRQPFHTLSTGQQFRANLARSLAPGAIVDEFTSVVDRNVAMSASRALRSWVNREHSTGIVLASCHRDIVPWLKPDWTIDTDSGTITIGGPVTGAAWFAEMLIGEEVARIDIS
jgi:ABC-type thiamine transport system ATPase subunit